MRTDWSGQSMTVHPYGDAYETTITSTIEYLQHMRGREPANLAKIGRVFLRIIELDEPPCISLSAGMPPTRSPPR